MALNRLRRHHDLFVQLVDGSRLRQGNDKAGFILSSFVEQSIRAIIIEQRPEMEIESIQSCACDDLQRAISVPLQLRTCRSKVGRLPPTNPQARARGGKNPPPIVPCGCSQHNHYPLGDTAVAAASAAATRGSARSSAAAASIPSARAQSSGVAPYCNRGDEGGGRQAGP